MSRRIAENGLLARRSAYLSIAFYSLVIVSARSLVIFTVFSAMGYAGRLAETVFEIVFFARS